jgi:acetyl-CoA C-acetyltransferase
MIGVLLMKPIWIIAAKRTPVGRFLGGLAKKSAVDLAVAAGKAALAGIEPAQVDLVVVGNVSAFRFRCPPTRST